MIVVRSFYLSLLLFLFLIFSTASYASYLAQEGVFIQDPERQYLPLLKAMKAYTVDVPNAQGYELWGPTGLQQWVQRNGIPFSSLKKIDKARASSYLTPEKVGEKLKSLAKTYPSILALSSLGKSNKKRDLWLMKINSPVNQGKFLPEFKYIANMHGDEIVGRELLVRLIEDLAKGYGQDTFITELLDNTAIYMMPSMNPDGAAKQTRGNGVGVDLNRDFPDFANHDTNTNRGRALETKLMMQFQNLHHFALSANFHGGAQVVNYPWDTIATPCPLEKLVQELSLEYASQNHDMANSYQFDQGITNGYAWYEVDGGMQDWSYYWYGDLQLTIELSNTKWPASSTINSYYQKNYRSLLSYLGRVHQGLGFQLPEKIKGQVTIAKEESRGPHIIGTYDFTEGVFYKVLEVGTYQVSLKTSAGKEYQFSARVDPSQIYLGGNIKYL
jgi:hypothetical protein